MEFFYLILILLSTAGVAFVLGSKIIEMKTGKIGPLGRLSVFADPLIKQKINLAAESVSKVNKSRVEKFLKEGLYAVFHVFGVAGVFISKYYSRFTSWVRGKKFLKGDGVVSFFLKGMAESKERKAEHGTQNTEHK